MPDDMPTEPQAAITKAPLPSLHRMSPETEKTRWPQFGGIAIALVILIIAGLIVHGVTDRGAAKLATQPTVTDTPTTIPSSDTATPATLATTLPGQSGTPNPGTKTPTAPPKTPTAPTATPTTSPPSAVSFTFFPLPAQYTGPADSITKGPDGAVWYTQGNEIERMTTNGSVTSFEVRGIQATATYGGNITTGPDGNLWFISTSTGAYMLSSSQQPQAPEHPYSGGAISRIGKLTPGGTETLYPAPAIDEGISALAAGPDGNLWFPEQNTDNIARITPQGTITEYPIPGNQNSNIVGITTGSDGNLWFTEFNNRSIGRITAAGVYTAFPIPNLTGYPVNIVAGPDGALWFTVDNQDVVGRITTKGTVTTYTLPTGANRDSVNLNSGGSFLGGHGLAVGADNALWFPETNLGKIGRITMNGLVSDYQVPGTNPQPGEITLGPDGNLWFTDGEVSATTGIGQIGRLTP